MKEICGFSKMSKLEKLNFVVDHYLGSSEITRQALHGFMYINSDLQKNHDQFSENTISNFHMPYGVVPYFHINGKDYCIPMVTEESSVVAACCKSAKFWRARGGFHGEVLSKIKSGQVHFYYYGEKRHLEELLEKNKAQLIQSLKLINSNMVQRGGGLIDIELIDRTSDDPCYYQLHARFNTCDAQGANYINTNLEALAEELKKIINDDQLEIIFSIVSNYTPESLVRCYISCPLEELTLDRLDMAPDIFARRFEKAVRISQMDVTRAVTHNKGIMNGVDAVSIATGNDFRALEAGVHAFASRDGRYQGLTRIDLCNGMFYYELILPISIGTVGGLTHLHPLARTSLEMLGNPSSDELMIIMGCVGLAQNFAAIKSLVTSGIQKGHMKMHLINILNYFEADEQEREKTFNYFKDKKVSFNEVRTFLGHIRNLQ